MRPPPNPSLSLAVAYPAVPDDRWISLQPHQHLRRLAKSFACQSTLSGRGRVVVASVLATLVTSSAPVTSSGAVNPEGTTSDAVTAVPDDG